MALALTCACLFVLFFVLFYREPKCRNYDEGLLRKSFEEQFTKLDKLEKNNQALQNQICTLSYPQKFNVGDVVEINLYGKYILTGKVLVFYPAHFKNNKPVPNKYLVLDSKNEKSYRIASENSMSLINVN